MKVLNISLDNKILDKDSAVAKRAISYGELLEEYFIVVPGKNQSIELSAKTKVLGIKGDNKFLTLFKIYQYLDKHLKDNKYDLITVQDSYYLAFLGILLAKKFGLKVEMQIHGFERFNFIRKLVFNYNIRNIDIARVVSTRLKDFIIKDYKLSKEKVYVIPVYVDIDKIENSPVKFDLKEEYKNYFILITVGRLVKVKNIELQLKALEGIEAKIKLLVIGDGPEKENLISLRDKLNLGSVVEFLGWKKDVLDYYKTADCLLLTSYSEGYPLVIVEAVSTNLPVIMTDVGNAGELVDNGKNGFIISNTQELRESILRLYNNKELISEFKLNNKHYINKIKGEAEIINIIVNQWEKAL